MSARANQRFTSDAKRRKKLGVCNTEPRLTNVARSGESWSQQKEAVRQHSESAARLGREWDCRCVIVKSHDDLRQDQLAAELLFLFDRFVSLSMQTLQFSLRKSADTRAMRFIGSCANPQSRQFQSRVPGALEWKSWIFR